MWVSQKQLREETNKETQRLDADKAINHFKSVRKTIVNKLVFDFGEELEVKDEEKEKFLEEIGKTELEMRTTFERAMNELMKIKRRFTVSY